MYPKQGTKDYRLVVEEKGYSGYLITLGKIDYFETILYNKKLDNTIINQIVPIENPREKQSFIEGQKIAKKLLDIGFTKAQYAEFLKDLNRRIKAKLEKTTFFQSIGHR